MGISEIIFILFMVLILFGADKLPEVARGLGKTMRQLRDATDEIKTEIHHHINHTGIDTTIVEDTQKETERFNEKIGKLADFADLSMSREETLLKKHFSLFTFLAHH